MSTTNVWVASTIESRPVKQATAPALLRSLRQWQGSLVAHEHHYDYRQSGGPLTSNDLYFDAAGPPTKRPSQDTIRSQHFDAGI